MKDKRLTTSAISKAVRALGYKNVTLRAGKGYYYWTGGVASKFFEQGVYGIRRLNDMSLQHWVNDFKERVKDARKGGRLGR